MSSMPILATERLVLRPFALRDARDVQTLARAPEVARTTALIPHPYPDGAAEQWISTHEEAFVQQRGLTLAILSKADSLIGCISLVGHLKSNGISELGYWIGLPFWGKGYCTEAASAIAAYGF